MLEKMPQTSDWLNMIKPDEAPTPINGKPPESCRDCRKPFPPRAVRGLWAEICLGCKRKRYHRLEGFPNKYNGIHLADCKEREGNKLALEDAKAWVRSDGQSNLWFYGSPGTGKTYIASAAASEGPIGIARFVSVPEMLLEFQGAVKEHDEITVIKKFQGVSKTFSGYACQIFDDIGAHRVSDFALEMFGILLERFYANGQVGLIFTSNLSPRELLDRMGERISSRLCGLATPIKLEGTDLRHEQAGFVK